MYRVARCAFSGWSARYFFITRTIRIGLSPLGTHASRSLLGTPSSSSCTRKPSVKPATQPRQVASRPACSSEKSRAASRLPSLSFSMPTPFLNPTPFSNPTLEQTSRKSLPDRLISPRERQSPDWRLSFSACSPWERPSPDRRLSLSPCSLWERPSPDRRLSLSGCPGVLFGEVLAGQPTSKKPSNAATSSRRTAASHHVARFYVRSSMLSATPARQAHLAARPKTPPTPSPRQSRRRAGAPFRLPLILILHRQSSVGRNTTMLPALTYSSSQSTLNAPFPDIRT